MLKLAEEALGGLFTMLPSTQWPPSHEEQDLAAGVEL